MMGRKRGPSLRERIPRPKQKRVKEVLPMNKYSPRHMTGKPGDLTRTYLNPAGPM
jgi:hypothetical protein